MRWSHLAYKPLSLPPVKRVADDLIGSLSFNSLYEKSNTVKYKIAKK